MSEHEHPDAPESYEGFRIINMWAFTQIGDDNEEGVIAMSGAGGVVLPLVASDRIRADDYRAVAQRWATESGKPVYEKHFVIESSSIIEPLLAD